jgi:hypothetical protein
MATGYRALRGKWILTVLVAVAALLAFWQIQPAPAGADKDVGEPVRPVDSRVRETAMRYAEALRAGDCDEVIALTAWMQDRLREAAEAPAGEPTPEEVEEDLCATLQNRSVEGNRLRPEGVEDRYVFAPGVELEPLAEDEGRNDLSRPVLGRLWIRVTYPAPDRALCDAAGRPIRSLEAGIHVTPEGCVAKAGVLGNAEVAPQSVSYGWGVDQGG